MEDPSGVVDMTNETLLKQFNRCYDENGWFVSIRKALDGLTAEQADWKAENAENSIWQSLTHLTYYNNAYLLRFKGTDIEYEVGSNDETFTGAALPSQEEWEKTVAEFDLVMTEWREQLNSADSSKLNDAVPNKHGYTWADLLADMNSHNAYHAGQVLLVRKLQGSWNKEKGVS